MRYVITIVITLMLGGCVNGFSGGSSPVSCLRTHEMAHIGGWGADHPGAINTAACGRLPMPPHAFPTKAKPTITYVARKDIWKHCGPNTQACASIGGGNKAWIVLPRE